MQIATLHVTTRASDGHGGDAVHFTPDRPIRFTAGQHAFWRIPGGGIHPFTIASAPEEDIVTLGTSLASRSPLKRVIAALAEGDRVRLAGPIADFTLDPTNPAVVMLAQGVGVTPYRSMLRHLDLTGRSLDTTLIQVAPEHPFRDDTETLARTSHYVTSREDYAMRLAEVVRRRPRRPTWSPGHEHSSARPPPPSPQPASNAPRSSKAPSTATKAPRRLPRGEPPDRHPSDPGT